jgi:hypothetical protein
VKIEKGFLDECQKLNGPRIDRCKLHAMEEVLFLTICGVLCNCESLDDIKHFGKIKLSRIYNEVTLELAPHIGKNSCIETDQLATYLPMFKTLYPTTTHRMYKGRPSTINHTLAMCRTNIN